MTEREQFEAWRERNDNMLDMYNEPDDCMWQAWQAARASQPVPEGCNQAVAKITVSGNKWYMDYLSLPEGTHKLYLRGIYLSAAPSAQSTGEQK
jgi:hypothetical protein